MGSSTHVTHSPSCPVDVHTRTYSAPCPAHLLGYSHRILPWGLLASQEIIEAAFFPSLRTVLQAPRTSPLYPVKPADVAEFLVCLTGKDVSCWPGRWCLAVCMFVYAWLANCSELSVM